MISTCSPTAVFSILDAKTRIPAHTGVSNTRLIVQLPLIVPPGCGFRVGAERREWHIWNPHITDAEREMAQTESAALSANFKLERN
jgi:Aspartyl/Asparaginyl beta-hydroxylase